MSGAIFRLSPPNIVPGLNQVPDIVQVVWHSACHEVLDEISENSSKYNLICPQMFEMHQSGLGRSDPAQHLFILSRGVTYRIGLKPTLQGPRWCLATQPLFCNQSKGLSSSGDLPSISSKACWMLGYSSQSDSRENQDQLSGWRLQPCSLLQVEYPLFLKSSEEGWNGWPSQLSIMGQVPSARASRLQHKIRHTLGQVWQKPLSFTTVLTTKNMRKLVTLVAEWLRSEDQLRTSKLLVPLPLVLI